MHSHRLVVPTHYSDQGARFGYWWTTPLLRCFLGRCSAWRRPCGSGSWSTGCPPLSLGEIVRHDGVSGLNQIRGGDLAALVVVVPVCLTVGWLACRDHPAAPVLALAPAIFEIYTYSQLILGNEYLHRPGNIERFFPLLLACSRRPSLRCWSLARPEGLPCRHEGPSVAAASSFSSSRRSSCSVSTCRPSLTHFATTRAARCTSPPP